MDGRPVAGTLSGTDEQAIRRQLRRNNLFITQLEALAGTLPVGQRSSLFHTSVKLYDLVVFSRQLSTLVRAGLNLNEALEAMSQQTRNETLRQAVLDMQRDILSGSTFTEAMKKHPKIFSELYVSLVEAGELGGMLDKTLDQAAEALDKEMEIREKVKSAFVYPIAVIVTATGVIGFMLTVVVPVFEGVYKQFRSELPPITKTLVYLSGGIRSYWWVLALLIVALIFVYIRAYRSYQGRRWIDGMKLRLPLFGHLIAKISQARMAHTLSSLMEAGVPLMRALRTAGHVTGNSLMMDALGEVSLNIQKGTYLGVALADTGRFPLIMTRMIRAGEESGNLGEMLSQVAHFFDREVEYGIKRLMTLMEPILTVCMGFVVGFILLALYMPIFNLGNVIK